MSGLSRAQLCPTLSFEGLYYWFLLLWGLAEPSLSPLPDMYPHLVIFYSFLGAEPIRNHAITVL